MIWNHRPSEVDLHHTTTGGGKIFFFVNPDQPLRKEEIISNGTTLDKSRLSRVDQFMWRWFYRQHWCRQWAENQQRWAHGPFWE